MKKFLQVFIAVFVVLMLSCTIVTANDDKVEISFCVGDATLMINGSEVTVEKPYVVGEGVTLVPIRVITEAFGAKVDWIEETQTVTLDYPDVNIVIQIDNPIAEVNGKAETLLAAPQLTDSGYTMIPLRFISENFGAEVTYDEATEKITVIKENSGDGTVSIKGAADSKYIGDSFYGWSMENPRDLHMDYRSFDGMETSFAYDDSNYLYIDIYTYDEEDYDFENEFTEMKMSISDYTLVKADKDTSNANCKWMHLSAKDKVDYIDYYQYVTPDYIYVVSGYLSNEDTKIRDNLLNILSTFKCSYESGDIYDLSNIKDGFRKFESEELKLSFDVPQNFYMATSEDAGNEFRFYENDDGKSDMAVVVYSKSDVKSASDLANEDYNHNKKTINESIVKFSDGVIQKQYDNISVYEYTYTIEATSYDSHKRDVFFEIGDYVYNMAVTIELPYNGYESYIDKIINSIKAESLDSDEVGILMKNVPVATGTIKAEVGKATMEVPNIYISVMKNTEMAAFSGSVNGVVVTLGKAIDGEATLSDVRKMMKTTETNLKEEYDAEIITSTHETVINSHKYFSYTAYYTRDEITVYAQEYVCLNKGTIYVLSIVCPEHTYSESTKAEIDTIVKSLKIS